MPYLNHSNCNIFYEVTGESGEWVTLINGHTRTHTDFRMFAKKLNQQGFRCLLFDNRGAGKTTCQADFSLVDISDDIIELWNHLGIPTSHIIGISMGGIIAQLHTIRYPKRILSLTLISTTSSRNWIYDVGNQPWVADELAVYQRMSHYFAPRFLEKNELLVRGMCKQIAKGLEDSKLQEGYKRQKEAMRSLNIEPDDYQIMAPTHIIHGKLDGIIDAKAAEETARRIPGSKLTLIEDVGHLLLAEWAKPLYEVSIDFLKQQK